MTTWSAEQNRIGQNYYRDNSNFCRFCGSPYRIYVRSHSVGRNVWITYLCGSCGRYYTIVKNGPEITYGRNRLPMAKSYWDEYNNARKYFR